MIDIPIIGGPRDGEWFTPTPRRSLPVELHGGYKFKTFEVNDSRICAYVHRETDINDAIKTAAARGLTT